MLIIIHPTTNITTVAEFAFVMDVRHQKTSRPSTAGGSREAMETEQRSIQVQTTRTEG